MKTLILSINILLVCLLLSCTNKEEDPIAERENTIGSGFGKAQSCPYFSSDINGNTVISWVEELNDSTEIVCYATLKEDGSMDQPVRIPSSTSVHRHGENPPKIIFKPNDEIIAMWGASNPSPQSKYSGLVYYAQSFDEGKTWTSAIPLVKDTSAYDQRYFDMVLLPDGEAMVIWLDNRGKKDKEGSTLFCAVTRDKSGFTNEKPIGETCCPCCRTDLYVDTKGAIHACYRDIINDSIRDMVHCVSSDGGLSFSPPERISADNWVINGCPHTGPTIAENKSGLHFAWYTMGGGQGVFYCHSGDKGKMFSKRDTVSTNPSAKHPQIGSTENGKVVIVWDESVKSGDNTNARIGLQVRHAEGRIAMSTFVSEKEAVSEFPVIKAINKNQVIVAFTKRLDEKNRIVYRILSI